MTARLWRWLRTWWWVAPLAMLWFSTVIWGYSAGRRSVKPVVETRVETRTVEVVKWRDRTVTQSNVAAQEQVRTRIETRWLPGKEVVRTEFVERATDTKRTDLAVRELDEDRATRAETKTVTAAAPRPRWSLGAVGGLTWTGERVYGGTAEVRVGPTWLGVNVTNKAALGSLRWSW